MQTNSRFKIGCRTLKTIFAVFICLLIFYFWDSNSTGLYACSASVICMKNTHDESWLVGRQNLIGTIIGGILGFLLVELIADRISTYFSGGIYIFLIPLGLIICIGLCNILQQSEGVSVACILFISIALDPIMVADSENTLFTVIFRVIEVWIGMSVAALINKYIFPFKEVS